MPANEPTKRVFVTGASGYVGGRLVPRLLDNGYHVRCLSRSPRKLYDRPWSSHPNLEIVAGDAEDEALLTAAMADCRNAFYLIHSMMARGDTYREHDRRLAAAFARAAATAGLNRIIYLGGLGETGPGLSEHLASRREVEAELRQGTVPVTVLRAAMIIGSGSASFEILRYLVERLPIMITPRWVRTESQPIAIRNVLDYLVAALDLESRDHETIDIGGPDVITYHDLMQTAAEELQLNRRWIIPVPVLTPRLSSAWIHLVTPLSHRIARPLAEGLRNRVVCSDNRAQELMPQDLLTVRAAIREAVVRTRERRVPTAWSDAGVLPGDPDWAGGTVYEDRRQTRVAAPASSVFTALCRIGGANGYFGTAWMWRLRGVMDRLVGGPGLRRGRRDPEHVQFGDALDFWRVTDIQQDRLLALRAEMKLPGEALLEFTIDPLATDPHACTLIQTARFKPRGLAGILYWWAVTPFHGVVFNTMLNGIKQAAEQEPAATTPAPHA